MANSNDNDDNLNNKSNLQKDLELWTHNMSELAVRIQEFSKLYFEAQQKKQMEQGGVSEISDPSQSLDPMNIGKSFLTLSQAMMKNPSDVWQKQMNLWGDYMQIWNHTRRRFMGIESQPVIEPNKTDKRFKSSDWNDNLIFDLIKQSYLVTAKATEETLHSVDDMPPKTLQKIEFFTKQFLDAWSPSNFAFTNPDVLKETLNSQGENLVKGLDNLLTDLKKGGGERLKISMTDQEAFKMGENIATTPGSVVFRNRLMELNQFSPTTDEVYKRPILIIPPWINKYYILDLRPQNSMIKWLVDQGFTVFCVSWKNPDATDRDMGFEDYMEYGIYQALDAIKDATGEQKIHAVGYCLGGTLLASTLAVMAKKNDDRIEDATFFTTLTDFSEPGELGIFIDEDQLVALEEKMAKKGYLDGSEMSTTFNMLRANDLIWSFVINNYLLGKNPFPFDLLYWNSDSTRMPYKMHSFYLRKMYQENALICKNALEMKGVGIDLTQIKLPTYILSTREDHIAPWKSTYAAVNIYQGPVKFVLAGSGHIAGVINPPDPDKPKYGYWEYNRKIKDPDQWLEKAEQHPGSWWPNWKDWLIKQSNEKTAASPVGTGKLPPLAPSPGDYVRVRV